MGIFSSKNNNEIPQGEKIGECINCQMPIYTTQPHNLCLRCSKQLPQEIVLGLFYPHILEERLKLKNSVLLTTTSALEGHKVIRIIDIVCAEYVVGINIFSDFMTGLSDVFGGRSSTYQNKLREAKNVCLTELRKEALKVGANAVLGVDLDYSEISGGGKSMLFLVANGTAVVAEPIVD